MSVHAKRHTGPGIEPPRGFFRCAPRCSLTWILSALCSLVCAVSTLASPAEPAPSTPAQRVPAVPLSVKEVRLGYFANITHAQAVLGIDSGDFARAVEPARFSTKVFNAGPSLIEALFAGEIDIGYVGPSPALAAHLQSRGRGIRVVAGAAGSGVVIVARAGSGITTLKDLKGKRIATPQLGNTQDVSARHYLTSVLGQPNADNVIPVANAEQVAMMTRGQIDAAWAVEPWGARLVAEAGGQIIAEEKDLWPDKNFTLALVVTTPEFLRDHPDAVERVLRVHIDWTRRLQADPSGQVTALADALERVSGKKLGREIIGAGISRVKFSTEPLAESLKAFSQWAFELKQARGIPDIDSLVETSLLEALQAKQPSSVPDHPAPAPPAPSAPATPVPGKD